MILVERGPEPKALADARDRELPGLQDIHERGGRPRSDQIKGYGDIAVRRALWEMQHQKCCYCEKDIELTREDVEHFRPKAEANRTPGSTLDHGYWWLSFTWDNLFYSCPQCNQPPYKGVRFPLEVGSDALAAGEVPPGRERPLLVHPAQESGVAHIEFVQQTRGGRPAWIPTPRGNSPKGEWTIRVCGLDREALVERYTRHVTEYVRPAATEVNLAIRRDDPRTLHETFERARRKLLHPRQRFVGLSLDALRVLATDSALAPFRLAWPTSI